MECCQGSIVARRYLTAVTALLPESECKGSTIFYTNKLFPLIFSKNCKKISFSAKIVAFITIIAHLYKILKKNFANKTMKSII
jgi:hypothetical protein